MANEIKCPQAGEVFRAAVHDRNLLGLIRIVKVMYDYGPDDWRVSAIILKVPHGYSTDTITSLYPKTVAKFDVWEKLDPKVWDEAMKMRSTYQNGLAVLYRDSEKIG